MHAFVFVTLVTATLIVVSVASSSILVVGSINADVIIPLDRMPLWGETITAKDTDDTGKTLPGGKGANQAVACRTLDVHTSFLCKFGTDANAIMLKDKMSSQKVDISACLQSSKPSGLGIVLLQSTGAVSCIVASNANSDWKTDDINNLTNDNGNSNQFLSKDSTACIMLQMEIPQFVNEMIAEEAFKQGIPVFQDIGGEERELSDHYLSLCTYISPNLTELKRLTKMEVNSETDIITAAKYLQSKGGRNILVTLGDQGCLLITEEGEVIKQPSYHVAKVVDETGAGDTFRAAFVVSHYVDKLPLQEAMAFASASGAVKVTKLGAMACSTRKECMDTLLSFKGGNIVNNNDDDITDESSSSTATTATTVDDVDSVCAYKFASRLNSMKARSDLYNGRLASVHDYIARQGTIEGLDLIDFNYPQHLVGKVTDRAKKDILHSLKKAGLACGAVCLRYPSEMQLGALTNPKQEIRDKAISLTKEACEWALALGCNEVVVWSSYDGYDYPLQVNYNTLWNNIVAAFQDICDAYPSVKVSLEYKPTDENTRYFAVPSTGAAILLMKEIDRANFGLTLDFGHCMMAGECPAQSVAMVSNSGSRSSNDGKYTNKLFGVQLGDGHSRIGAEDGLMFGSIHSTLSLEFVLWLIKTNYKGHIYFDTFPRNEDVVKEAEYNIKTFKRMYRTAMKALKDGHKLDRMLDNHDALSMMEYLQDNQ